MRVLFIAALVLAPLCGLHAEQGPALKSAVIVEQGLFKKGWEYDFFRDIPSAERPEESPDAVTATAPDEVAPLSDDDGPPRPRRVGSSLHRNRAADPTPAVVALPDESVKEPDPVAPPPPEQLLLPPTRPDPGFEKSSPGQAAVASPPSAAATDPAVASPPVDNKKKQKDRARELDSKRKKGNFRDPKITY